MKQRYLFVLKNLMLIVMIISGIFLFNGCAGDNRADEKFRSSGTEEISTESITEEPITEEITVESAGEQTEEATETATPSEPEKINPRTEVLIALDPGHQSEKVDMSAQEPNAPGSDDMKAGATSGTEGRYTGVPEYKLNLDIALKVRDKLEELGYQVIMTREDNDTAISNKERACLANDAGADISVRIHANGCDDSSVSGALAIIGSSSNSYVGHLYDDSYRLAECILDEYTAATGMENRGITLSDSMTGINWSEIPVMILEMGFMSNESDDYNMQDPDYQEKMVEGIVNGIEKYYDFTEADYYDYYSDDSPVQLDDESKALKNELETKLQDVRNEGTRCSAYMKNLKTGEVIDFSLGKQKAASVIKLFVAGAVYLHYDELLDKGYTRDDLEPLIKKMISESDNDATNSLIRILGDYDTEAGMDIVNKFIASYGYKNTSMGRLMLDFDTDKENYVDSSEVGDYLEKLYRGNEVKGSNKIISYMKKQVYTEKIPSVLPEGVVVANKTGDLLDTDNDAAIIYGDEADYILCIFADELDGTALSSQTIKEISSMVYECWE